MYRIEQALSSRINILQEHGLMEHTNIKQYRSELFYECFIHVYSGLTHNMNNCANLRKLYGDGDTLLQLCLNKTSTWKKNNHNCWRNILSYTYTLHNWNARQKKCFIDLLLVEIRSYRKNELEDVCSWVVGGDEYFFGSLHKNRNAVYEPTRNELLQEDISKIHNPHERLYNNRMNPLSSPPSSVRFESTTSKTSTDNAKSNATSNATSNVNVLIPKKKHEKNKNES